MVHFKIRENGSYKIIDIITVHLDSKKDVYWAHLLNTKIRDANISNTLVNDHDKMVLGGIWAIIEVAYNPTIKIGSSIFLFVVKEINPIQLSSFDNSKVIDNRRNYAKAEWADEQFIWQSYRHFTKKT